MDLTRYQQAWAKNAIPRQTLEDQEKLVLQDQGTVKNDEGTVQYDQVQVGYCHITSPITGRVGLRLVDPGNLVTANSATTLVVITQLQPITVIFTLAEDNLGQVVAQMRHGKQLPVDAWDRDRSTQLASGKLMTLDNFDRHHHGHRQGTGAVSEQQWRAVPESVREYPSAGEHARQPDHGAVFGDPA